MRHKTFELYTQTKSRDYAMNPYNRTYLSSGYLLVMEGDIGVPAGRDTAQVTTHPVLDNVTLLIVTGKNHIIQDHIICD
jgi:hypothetical protein